MAYEYGFLANISKAFMKVVRIQITEFIKNKKIIV